jgi:hypothetical protein
MGEVPMSMNVPPGLRAQIDQLAKRADVELGALLTVYTRMRAENGTDDAIFGVLTVLDAKFGGDGERESLILAALARLADLPPERTDLV